MNAREEDGTAGVTSESAAIGLNRAVESCQVWKHSAGADERTQEATCRSSCGRSADRSRVQEPPVEGGETIAGLRSDTDSEGRAVDRQVLLDRLQGCAHGWRRARGDTEGTEDLQALACAQPTAEVAGAGGPGGRLEEGGDAAVADEAVMVADCLGPQVGARVSHELRTAVLGAEVVGLSLVLGEVRRVRRVDVHAADRVGDQTPSSGLVVDLVTHVPLTPVLTASGPHETSDCL